ncbi:MAG: mycofactocin-associated electron transfer flavoprotein beta subunit [Ilumatobacteraceae bacterium]
MTFIAVCMKWVSGRPEIDALSGEVREQNSRFGGVSAADQAALEMALRIGTERSMDVTAITVGGTQSEPILYDALAAGATLATRIDSAHFLSSAETARVMAPALADAAYIFCGDYSNDRGSGSVPAFLAAELGVRQALGVVALTTQVDSILLTRRLGGGRREHSRVTDRAVISVEGSVARLRRASLANSLSTRDNRIHVIPLTISTPRGATTCKPFRPRPRTISRPHGETALQRIHAITDVASASARGEQIELTSAKSAQYILQTLARWGYIDRAQ